MGEDERRKLIVVSNRGPVSFGRGGDGQRTAKRGGGGLVTALRSLVSHHDVTWIASAITPEDRAVAYSGLRRFITDATQARVFAGGQGGNLNYVLMKDLEAEKKLKDRRAKAREKATPETQ